MERITKADALSRERFHEELRDWMAHNQTGATIGDADGYGGKAWLWIKYLGNRYHLNADTTHSGVAEYLGLLAEHEENLRWAVVANARGGNNKVAFGPDQDTIAGFYLYRA